MPNVSYYSGIRIFRFNHAPSYGSVVDTTFTTWAVNYVHSGRILFSVDGCEPQVLEGPVAFWTWPGPRWRYEPADESWDHYFISWKGPKAVEWQEGNLHPMTEHGKSFCKITDPKGFKKRFESLLALLDQRQLDDPEAVHELQGLLLRMHSQPKLADQTIGLVLKVRDVIEAVRREPERDWDFVTEAENINCTPVHFRRLWKQETGLTPVRYLQDRRLHLAAKLLRQNELHVDEISYKVGFETPSYFTRLFSRAHEMPPVAYRKAYQSVQ